MPELNDQDITVLRVDPSISGAAAAEGRGEADPPRVLKQRFVLDEKLGSGGMGTVFRAKDLRKVEARDRQPFLAVKVLNNDFREHPEAFIALQREAAKSQVLSHPNVVSIFDFDKDGDVPFIIMELLEGQELADLIRAYPNGLPEEMAWKVIKGMCAGLHHAHEAGIVHADFKPGNVFVSPENAAKILDFGIARAAQVNQGHGEDTEFDPARLAALTPAYASREMLNGDNPEVRDDVYSLGIVIYLVLTGHHPYGRASAADAAAEGLRPERPKRLSRRQWRVLERCLRFNRVDRPASVETVSQHLLGSSPWRSRTLSAAAAALVLALSINYFVDDAELTEVKKEVRHSTLMDVQLVALARLLDAPTFEPAWEQQVVEELDALAEMQPSQEAIAGLSGRLTEIYSERIAATPDPAQAAALLVRGQTLFGPFAAAAESLHERMVRRVLDLLDAPVAESQWIAAVSAELLGLTETFPNSKASALLQLEFSDLLETQLLASLDQDRFPFAERAIGALTPILFDTETLERLTRLVADAEVAYAVAEQRRFAKDDARAFKTELGAALRDSCLRLNVAQISNVFDEWTAKDSGLAEAGRKQIGTRLGECVAQLAELDTTRAQALRQQAQSTFGDLPALARRAFDPCGLEYLLGAGGQSGRGGYCSDALPDGGNGPRLVVIPKADGAGRFAITKHEVSWGQFNRFCAEFGRCQDGPQDQLPVTGIDLATAADYARWLSGLTGYVYRLPTTGEWQRAAAGVPDPNRNCRIQTAGVQRGLAPVPAASGQANDYGLVNILGNVQEWVLDQERVFALGGAYSDPIEQCVSQTVRPHGGAPDAVTGFRLVREVS
jgi:hypothetical protein